MTRVTRINPYRKVRKPSTKTRTPATKKVMFTCVGGPWDGEKLCLQSDGKTLPFQINGEFGYYQPNNTTIGQTEWNRC